jgi:hypothetical protein
MNIGLAMLLALPAISCAQNLRTVQAKSRDHNDSAKADAPRRLETVTWNSVSHKLTWVISSGEQKQGADYRPLKSMNYLISLDEATMSFGDETRRFSQQEATNVLALMGIIGKYAVDSTVWWDEGQGEPVKGGKTPEKQPDGPAIPDEDSVATLHVSMPAVAVRPGLSAAAVHQQILKLEKRLAELRRIERQITAPGFVKD